MEKSIYTSQRIDIYFNHMDDALQFEGDGEMPYTADQILHTV